MPTPTTELGLQKGVDADDTADYLTISLANSLGTLDALFNNVSGHTHAGPHQGGPISSSALQGAVDIQDWFRSTGHTTAFATTGAGLEMYYDSAASTGVVQAYNRATATMMQLNLDASRINLNCPLYAVGGGSIGDGGADPVVAGQHLVAINALTVTPGHIYAAGLQVNGDTTLGGNGNVTGTLTTAWLTVTNDITARSLTMTGGLSGPTSFTLAAPAVINSSGTTPIYMRPGGGAAVTIDSGPLSVATQINCATLIASTIVQSPNHQMVSGMYIQQANATVIRYAVPAGGYHSMEASSGGYAPVYASAFTPNSALKDKANLRLLEDPLSYVQDERLHAVRYDDRRTGEERIGFVADVWQAFEPSLVALNTEGAVEALDYDRIGAIVFEALKQYIARTDTRLSALEDKAA